VGFDEVIQLEKQKRKRGAFIPDSCGKLHPVFPFFGYFSSDWPEGKS